MQFQHGHSYEQPIVACATPRGEGAVSIVRISGSGVFSIADRMFKPTGSRPFSSYKERHMVFGILHDMTEEGRIIDRCLAVRFVGPRSFSGEDMVEFQLHGNPLIVDSVIGLCVDLGCRPAQAGEFSRRAFLNGKMDLAQAEGLAEVIRAESESALYLAQRQLGGALSAKLNEFRRELVRFLALLELELDFVQEGYELLNYDELKETVSTLAQYVDSLLALYRSGDRLRRGPRVLLLGRPNAGKSSLFNAILGHSRALVSDVPGTTRDYLEERFLYKGVILHLLDTAGLRSTEDQLEAEGVSRAQDLLPLADHVLYLIDCSLTPGEIEAERSAIASLSEKFPQAVILAIYTKADIASPPRDTVSCSIFQHSSINKVLDLVVQEYSRTLSDQVILLTERQFHLLKSIRRHIDAISLDPSIPSEFLSADLRELLTPLSELTGEVTNEDILDAVFSGFCIGK